MSLLSYNELCELVERGVIGPVEPSAINAASIDVRLLGYDVGDSKYPVRISAAQEAQMREILAAHGITK